jgi:hypothetical protein
VGSLTQSNEAYEWVKQRAVALRAEGDAAANAAAKVCVCVFFFRRWRLGLQTISFLFLLFWTVRGFYTSIMKSYFFITLPCRPIMCGTPLSS